jgi:hypothetical protein
MAPEARPQPHRRTKARRGSWIVRLTRALARPFTLSHDETTPRRLALIAAVYLIAVALVGLVFAFVSIRYIGVK